MSYFFAIYVFVTCFEASADNSLISVKYRTHPPMGALLAGKETLQSTDGTGGSEVSFKYRFQEKEGFFVKAGMGNEKTVYAQYPSTERSTSASRFESDLQFYLLGVGLYREAGKSVLELGLQYGLGKFSFKDQNLSDSTSIQISRIEVFGQASFQILDNVGMSMGPGIYANQVSGFDYQGISYTSKDFEGDLYLHIGVFANF